MREMPMKSRKTGTEVKASRTRGSNVEVIRICRKGGDIRTVLNGGL